MLFYNCRMSVSSKKQYKSGEEKQKVLQKKKKLEKLLKNAVFPNFILLYNKSDVCLSSSILYANQVRCNSNKSSRHYL